MGGFNFYRLKNSICRLAMSAEGLPIPFCAWRSGGYRSTSINGSRYRRHVGLAVAKQSKFFARSFNAGDYLLSSIT